MAGIGFSIAHDALHGGYSSNPHQPHAGFTFDLIGANGYMWKITHNVFTTRTPTSTYRRGLTVSPLLRLSPRGTQVVHRYQHIYASPRTHAPSTGSS